MIGLWYVARLDRSPTSVDVAFCVACGGRASDHAPVFAMPFVEAPYCSDCAERAKRKEWSLPFAMMAAAFVLPSVVLVLPFGDVKGALLFAFAASLAVPCLYVAFGMFSPRAGSAVRAHKLMPAIQIDCSRRDVAEALVAECGGYVASRRALRLTPAVAFVPLTVASCAFGAALAHCLFVSTIAFDNGADADAVMTIDRRRDVRVPSRAHETVDVRVGRHTIAWPRGGARVERSIDLDRRHDAIVDPGPTSCHRKEIIAAGILTASDRAEIASAGLMPLDELQILPTVSHWFSPLPLEKKAELFEPNVEIAIQHDDACTAYVGCASFVGCVNAAADAAARSACVARAPTLCR